jgi:ribonucleoside-diphosphate reductase alpha chain
VQKHHIAKLPEIAKRGSEEKTFIIPDSIEGWADAVGVLASSYFNL